jgi:protein-ribulosamine 3-kinase
VSAQLAISIGSMIGATLRPQPRERVHGGSINECYRWETDAGAIFVKLAPVLNIEMFAAEAAGLEELRRANAVRVPRVLAVGCSGAGAVSVGAGTNNGTGAGIAGDGRGADPRAWLALEWIQTGPATATTDAALGEQLGKLHRATQTYFGWSRDNTIGSTPQLNAECADWITFYRDLRLRYQLDLAAKNGFNGRLRDRGATLLDCLPHFFRTHKPTPSLLHGDLWGGNRLADNDGQPVIFDPAVYYGDREADIAMTRLFGGYGKDFYAAYATVWPLDPGHEVRTDLYNLYHVLNHLNLFGGGYLRQATGMIDRLLAAAGR